MSPPQKAAEDPRREKADQKDTKDVQPYDRRDEGYFSYYAMLTHQAQMLQVCPVSYTHLTLPTKRIV